MRLGLQFRRAMYNLRGGFLVRPLIIALTLGFTGAVLSILEATSILRAESLELLFPSGRDPQVAQVILAGIAASTMTVVSIVFAILLMTLTLASMQFSPRIIRSFVQDRLTQWTLGIFLGTFLYCIAVLPVTRSVPQPFTPLLAVMGAMLLAVACVGWLLFFIQHISYAISVNQIVDRIAADTIAVIEETMPWPHRNVRLDAVDPTILRWDTNIASESSGYIRFIDQKRLIALAKSYRVKLNVTRRIGHFVPAGIPLIISTNGDRLTPEAIKELLGTFDFGPMRTLQQDVEFGVLQIVDIALKAISPAVNDPTTAIGCVDQLSRILIRFVAREPPDPVLYDPPGTVRVMIPWIGFEGLMDSAFEQIRLYAKSDVAVSLRLLRAFADIMVTTSDPEYQRSLVERAKRVIDGCAEKLRPEELRILQSRFDTIGQAADLGITS